MNQIVKFILLLGFAFGAMTSIAFAQSPNYDAWDKILKQYVDEQGLVDYVALKNNKEGLVDVVETFEQVDVSKMTAQEQKAFWINAYNAITLRTVVDSWPVKTIRRINFGLVWNLPRKVAQGRKSLGDIEHKILRPLGDARIHFAINCASIGCPKLPDYAFLPEKLDEQLDYETKRFVNDPEKVRLDRSTKTLYHSEIFSWFEEDFLPGHGSIKTYITHYINEDDQQFLKENPDVKVEEIPYDWGINKQ